MVTDMPYIARGNMYMYIQLHYSAHLYCATCAHYSVCVSRYHH